VKPEVRQGLDDSRRHLQIAQDLLDHENADDVAASRAYYAMFYAATAALAELGQGYCHQAQRGAEQYSSEGTAEELNTMVFALKASNPSMPALTTSKPNPDNSSVLW
jgi:uncharacterized protein (UPF0332 family)